jgi:hypothetical protein
MLDASAVTFGEFADFVNSLPDRPRGSTLQALAELCAAGPPDSVREVMYRAVPGLSRKVKFKTWLAYYKTIAPDVDRLFQVGRHPNARMSVERKLVCAIAATDLVAQACREGRRIAVVQKSAKNVFGWLRTLPGELQIGAVKSTINMKMIQDFALTKVPEVMETYLGIRRAMKT